MGGTKQELKEIRNSFVFPPALEKKVNDKAKTTIKFTELYVDNKNKNYQSTSNFVNENFVAVNSFIR